MPLTVHQEFHLRGVLKDADNLIPSERSRVKEEAQDMLDEKVAWPNIQGESDIHDWIELPAQRNGLIRE